MIDTLIDLIADQDLVLVEGSGDVTDHYGRLLRYVYVDDKNVNERMLAEGRAVTLQGDHRYKDEFVEIGNLAAEAMLGMWAPDACGPTSPPGASISNSYHTWSILNYPTYRKTMCIVSVAPDALDWMAKRFHWSV